MMIMTNEEELRKLAVFNKALKKHFGLTKEKKKR